MTMLSYARNAEDVVLARLFAEQPPGAYLDCGAGDPERETISRHLHAAGWRGVHVAADASLAAAIAAARPGDLVLDAGTPLEAVLSGHAPPGGFDFLRVALGGGETAALTAIDWQAVRPPLLLVNAVDAEGTPNHHGWHRRLINAGYKFALFDGLNRYYVRDDAAEAMLPLLAAPANALDDWRRADAPASGVSGASEEDAAAARAGVAAAEREAEALRERLVAAERETASLRDAVADALRDAAALRETTAAATREAATLRGQLDTSQAQAGAAAARARQALDAATARVAVLEAELETLRTARSGGWFGLFRRGG